MEPTLGRHVVDKQAIALNSFDQDCGISGFPVRVET